MPIRPTRCDLTLRILYALVPSVCNLLAIAIAIYYPISGEIHGRIRAAIGRRQAGPCGCRPPEARRDNRIGTVTMETSITIPLDQPGNSLAAMMTVGWVFSVWRHNVTIVDSLWGLGFVLVAGVTFWTGSGFTGRSLLVLIADRRLGLASGRVSDLAQLGSSPKTIATASGVKKSGGNFWIVSLFKVFWLQALFLWVISLVLQKAQLAHEPPRLTGLDMLGALVWLPLALFSSRIGDWQLARFKADPKNRGKVMDRGLWAWSRHPNYFGEFLIWWGFFLVALATPGGWWTVISPIIISDCIAENDRCAADRGSPQNPAPGLRRIHQKDQHLLPPTPEERRLHEAAYRSGRPGMASRRGDTPGHSPPQPHAA
jgi:steroid 5-alpha reductase family enzyme